MQSLLWASLRVQDDIEISLKRRRTRRQQAKKGSIVFFLITGQEWDWNCYLTNSLRVNPFRGKVSIALTSIVGNSHPFFRGKTSPPTNIGVRKGNGRFKIRGSPGLSH